MSDWSPLWLATTVHEEDGGPRPTGLLDSKGRMLYREPPRMGFDTTPAQESHTPNKSTHHQK